MDERSPAELHAFWSSVASGFQLADSPGCDRLYFLRVEIPNALAESHRERLANPERVFRLCKELACALMGSVNAIRAAEMRYLNDQPNLLVVGSTGPNDDWARVCSLAEMAAHRIAASAVEDGDSLELGDHPEMAWFLMCTSRVDDPHFPVVKGQCCLTTDARELAQVFENDAFDDHAAMFTRLIPSLAHAGQMFARRFADAFAEDVAAIEEEGKPFAAGAKLPKTRRGFLRLAETMTRDQPIIAALKEGKSYRQVARECGVGKTTVERVAKAYELTGHTPDTVPLEGTLQENLSIRGKPRKHESK